MALRPNARVLALAALASVLGCQRCSGAPSAGSSGAASVTGADTSSPTAAGSAPATAALPVDDVPEVRDVTEGRATAALRAVLQAYGVTFDAAAIFRECNVDDEGASIDDLEDVAVKYGLEAGSVIAPIEHVLLPEAKMLPAIVVVDTADEEQEFVVAWRLDKDRVQIMDPREGRKWVQRADLQKSLHVHEMAMPVDEYREAMAAPAFGDALRARMAALDPAAGLPGTLFDKAAADPGWRGLAALDAAIRKVEAVPRNSAESNPTPQLAGAFACAFEKRCEGVEPVPPALWSVQPAPNGPQGEAQVRVRGAVLLAIAGRAAPEPEPEPAASATP